MPKTDIIFLTVGKSGKYLHVKPDFKKGKFTSTKFFSDPAEQLIIPFGFKKRLQGNGFGYHHDSNFQKSKNQVRLRTFKNLIDLLHEEAKHLKLTKILIEIVSNQDMGTSWDIAADYQFLIEKQ